MSSLDKFYDFTLNLPDAKLTSKAMSLCNIDRNVFNIYLTLQEGKNNPISNESLGDYTVTMIVVKPKTKEYVEKVGVIDGSNDRLLFELGETFNDQIGSYKGEIKVQSGDEVITSSSFAYTVTQSLISGLNAEIEANPDVEILRQLINEVKAAVGMTPEDPDSLLTDYQTKVDDTLITVEKEIPKAINEVSTQIKDNAKDLVVENGKLYLKKEDDTKIGLGIELPSEVTDEQVNTAVNNYMINNPIEIGDLWGEIADGEVFEVTLPPKQTGINALFTQGNTTVYTDTSLNDLKSMLIVKKVYDNNSTEVTTNYTLSGTLTVGTSMITVTSGSYTATFTVIVSDKPTAILSSISSVFTQGSTVIYPSTSLDTLKPMLIVTALYNDNSSVVISGYTLSGTLTVGTSVITVTYEGKTDTFNVIVTKESGYVTNGLAGYYDLTSYSDGYKGDIADLSGNNMPMKIYALTSASVEIDTYNPIKTDRVGFVGGKFMCNNFNNVGDTVNTRQAVLGIPNNVAFTEYPFSVEIYAHLRLNYNHSGDMVLSTSKYTSLYQGTIMNTQTFPSTGNGLFINAIDGKLEIKGNTSKPFVNGAVENLQIDGNTDATPTNLYHHIIACFDSGKQTLYCDGVKVIDTVNESIAISGSTRDMMFFLNSSGNFLRGDMKLVRVYKNKFLSDAEVTKNYNDVISTIGGAS